MSVSEYVDTHTHTHTHGGRGTPRDGWRLLWRRSHTDWAPRRSSPHSCARAQHPPNRLTQQTRFIGNNHKKSRLTKIKIDPDLNFWLERFVAWIHCTFEWFSFQNILHSLIQIQNFWLKGSWVDSLYIWATRNYSKESIQINTTIREWINWAIQSLTNWFSLVQIQNFWLKRFMSWFIAYLNDSEF